MIAKEQKSKKRNISSEGKSTEKKLCKRDDNETDAVEDFDQAEVDEVLAAQEFPTKKISKKKLIKKNISEDEGDNDVDNSETVPAAINYLLSWKSKEKGWKFSKLRQTWLLQNLYNKEKVSLTLKCPQFVGNLQL